MRTALYEHGIGREFISVLYFYCLSCRLHETTTYNKMSRGEKGRKRRRMEAVGERG